MTFWKIGEGSWIYIGPSFSSMMIPVFLKIEPLREICKLYHAINKKITSPIIA